MRLHAGLVAAPRRRHPGAEGRMLEPVHGRGARQRREKQLLGPGCGVGAQPCSSAPSAPSPRPLSRGEVCVGRPPQRPLPSLGEGLRVYRGFLFTPAFPEGLLGGAWARPGSGPHPPWGVGLLSGGVRACLVSSFWCRYSLNPFQGYSGPLLGRVRL